MKNVWERIKEDFRRNKKTAIIGFISLVIVYSFLIYNTVKQEDPVEITYNEFWQLVDEGKVDTVYYSENYDVMRITLFNDITKNMSLEERKKYDYDVSDMRFVRYPAYKEFRRDALKAGVYIQPFTKYDYATIVYLIIELGVSIAFVIILMRVIKSQMHGLSESELLQTSDVVFDDIIGHEEIIDDIKFITELIKDPAKGDKVGAKLPKGLLFVGPPGTGKTLLAKAIAHEAGVPFLYQNASGFIELYVGLGAKRVRDLFKYAKKNAPCILFIDEIDAIGEKRGSSKGTQENDQVINAILQEMDGFKGREGVFVIAATNRADILDEALVRSGRFDRQIVVSPPRDWMVRRDLFKHYLAKFKVADDVDVDNISKQVSGFTGADIAMICNEASIIAVMHDKDALDAECIEEAIDKKIFKGNRSKQERYKNDTRVVAYHEAGHAVMSYILGEPIARASIQSSISGVGGAVFNQDKETFFVTKSDMINRVMIAYAGRVSEQIKFEDVTSGASNDITQATELMIQYIEKLGFDDDFGLLDVSVLSKEHIVNSSVIAEKLQSMSKRLYNDCYELLKAEYDKVELLASKLLEVETLSGVAIDKLFAEQ